MSGGTLSSSSRTGCESRMFGGHYTSTTAAFDRVKYGCLNHCVEPAGVGSASGYGDSFLLLQSSTVRARVTVAPHDSLGTSPPLATLEHFAHVLSAYSESELKEVIQVAMGEKRSVEGNSSGSDG